MQNYKELRTNRYRKRSQTINRKSNNKYLQAQFLFNLTIPYMHTMSSGSFSAVLSAINISLTIQFFSKSTSLPLFRTIYTYY